MLLNFFQSTSSPTHTHTHRQSVRLRASRKLKQREERQKVATNSTQNEPQKELKPLPKIPLLQKTESSPAIPPLSSSPVSSDSEVDMGPSQLPKLPRPIKKGIQSKIRRFEHRSSESSLSEDNSTSPSPSNLKPSLKPKPPQKQSRSLGDVASLNAAPSKPPRPKRTELATAHKIPQIIREPPAERPVLPQRPTNSVIRRAHEKQPGVSKLSAFKPIPQRRSPSPSPIPSPHLRSPLGPLCEESGEESDCSSLSTGSNRLFRTPMTQHQGQPLADTTAPLIPPYKPLRGKRSEGEAVSLPPVPTAASAAGSVCNHQMAEMLIKYVLASGDQGLISAIRDVVMADPEAIKIIRQ